MGNRRRSRIRQETCTPVILTNKRRKEGEAGSEWRKKLVRKGEGKKASQESGLWEFLKSTPPCRDFDQVDGDYRC